MSPAVSRLSRNDHCHVTKRGSIASLMSNVTSYKMSKHGPDLERMSTHDYIAFINSKVDVKHFYRLQGINIEDDYERNKIAESGRKLKKWLEE